MTDAERIARLRKLRARARYLLAVAVWLTHPDYKP